MPSGLATLAALMRSRRFAPLFWCQFLSAFNDNFVRNMLAMLILFRLGETGAGALITLAVGIFVAPTLILSGLGGEIADAQDKARFARALKGAEIAVQALAAIGLWMASLPVLYAALFGLGVISALFGPLKYAILPELMARDQLVAGNALVEAATFAAILLGLIAGGLSVARSPASTMLQLMAIALAAFLTSLFIPSTARAAPGLLVTHNIFASTAGLIAELRRDAKLWSRSIAVSWFWMVGAVALSLTPVIVRAKTGGDIAVETAISALFALGIGAGSLAAALIARGRIILSGAPFAALGMGLFLIDLGVSTAQLPAATTETGLLTFFASAAGVRVAVDVLGLASAGGLFVVPLFAAIQADAPPAWRARLVAAVNVLNSTFIVAGVAATAILQSAAIGLSEPVLSILLGVLTVAFALYVRRCVAPAPVKT
ncbi:major facilitator superfamily MFS_1 [Methylocella silvestris BL2]|uniref:Major facilitator superfamily MFS_1 n=1 Tax=Methylocella silvestris (strain DSM 15510 / CIP 108128 / LMG 27833 / NCIMB 13906 / BL2) TaxID=395965 RepID=B8EN43_METSB|nr:MFS transporter [Methylocella silvestris]ACK49178.1 major facilitator superfamily MFS_1 [Methylocella silvestris BL2]